MPYCNNPAGAACSGSLIAPDVVLTAGHCVRFGCQRTSDPNTNCVPTTGGNYPFWFVSAPFAGQQSQATQGAVFDWQSFSESVDPNHHDIGLVFLDRPITIASYPTIPTGPVADGSQLQNLGRIHDGSGQGGVTESMWIGPAVQVGSAAPQFAFDYYAQDVIESGDSGGPDVVPGTHVIAAVNSGGGAGGPEIMARTDLLSDWIQQQIASHGGTTSSTSVTSSSTTASTGAAGEDCQTCGNAALTPTGACGSPLVTCENDQACVDLYNCTANCGSDQTCADSCVSAAPSTAGTEYENVLVCVYCSACVTACGTATQCGSATTTSSTGTSTSSLSSGTGASGSTGAGSGAGGHHGGNIGDPQTDSASESGGCATSPGGDRGAVELLGIAAALSLLGGRRRRARG